MAIGKYYNRLLKVRADKSFFLWGPRQVGKTKYLESNFPKALRIDLLMSENYVRYLSRPELLRAEIERAGVELVVIDEIQKVPALLNEVHWLTPIFTKAIHPN